MKLNAKVSQTACDDESNKISSSAQTVASIDDLLIEIFLSIPLKPLVQMKLVSKHWNFVISDQNFKKNPNPAVGLIFMSMVPYLVSFEKPFHVPLLRTLKFGSRWTRVTTLMNSCNGLLLCKGNNQIYFVCNPTTTKLFTLPKTDDPLKLCSFYSMCLAFDPSKSPHYKVVCVCKRGYYHPIRLEVYSSETGCWRKHGEPFSAGVDFSRGVYWNGAIHWISKTSTGQSLYFNLDNDRVPQVMPTPPMVTQRIMPYYSSRACNSSYFGESCGHLHYIEDDKAVKELNVYEMRTDYSEWFLKYRVDCSLIDNYLASILCALIRGKKDENSFLIWGSEKRITRHNLVYKTCETIYETPDTDSASFFPIYHHPLQYIESLSHV